MAKSADVGFLIVRRDDAGYHVILRMPGLQWTPEAKRRC
jgi:hypothetical protein